MTSEAVDRELARVANDIVKGLEPPLNAHGLAYVLVLVSDKGRHVVRSNVTRTSVAEVLEDTLHAVKGNFVQGETPRNGVRS